MPKLEPKIIQRELEVGDLWPVYWVYGPEQMKARELLQRVRSTMASLRQPSESNQFSEEIYYGSEVSTPGLVDSARNLSLGGGPKLIIVKEAHALKDQDGLAELLGPKMRKEEVQNVCVFIAKDLDARKKFSKLLIEKTAVVPCDAVPERDREAWVQYLGKRRGQTLSGPFVAWLCSMDPWNLDIVDQEIQKQALVASTEEGQDMQWDSKGIAGDQLGDAMIQSFFNREKAQSLKLVRQLAHSPEHSIPLVGLLGWNLRYLGILTSDKTGAAKKIKLNPYAASRLQAWSGRWKFEEVLRAQEALCELDFGTKQTGLDPVGLWTQFLTTSLN
ncbi:hypothetical protein K2X30_05450 [bacterium]|nr:hypothetical protein [bacterium]